MRCPMLAALLAALACACTDAAHAGRPLQTEDAGIVDAGSCEFESARLRSSGTDAVRLTTGGVNCGFTGGQIGLAALHQRGSGNGNGITGAELGGKIRLWKAAGEGDGGPALALAWSLTAERSGTRWRHAETMLAGVLSVPVGPGQVHANLGRVAPRGAPAATLWNLAYEHEGWPVGGLQVAPMAEVFGLGASERWVNAALRLTLVPERVYVDGSWGRRIGASDQRLTTLGMKIAF